MPEDHLFLSPAFQALTIGLPFSVFKLLFGRLSLMAAAEHDGTLSLFLWALGWLVAAWACSDLLMNLGRVYFQIAGKPSPIEYCTIAQAGRLFHKPRLFLAVDTLISFSIICFALWSGWIAGLSRLESYLWYAATTLNLISISLVNIWIELEKGRQ
ncbi:MAG TPA: hypothetical protein PKK11_05400 [Methanothrix sp.]|nr:hypothetical protein [Methanothrix sp.]HPT19102.1 hypothetical protein [Methanothrix sp.]